MSAFVPTNVISITDGQIFRKPDLFNAGIRPAINAGISVSRVVAAQTKVSSAKSGGIRSDLAQYRELAARAVCPTWTPPASSWSGARVTELMKQPQYAPAADQPDERFAVRGEQGFRWTMDVKKIPSVRAWPHGLPEGQEAALLGRKIEESRARD